MAITRHSLSLDIPHIASPDRLLIRDTSAYAENLPVVCPRLDITVPGEVQPIYVTDLQPGFNYLFTSDAYDCDVRDKPQVLPDGVYKVCYSVSPNEKTMVCYYFLRHACLYDRYMKMLCELIATCEDETKQRHDLLERFNRVRLYMDAARAKAEVCHAPNQAMELYEYASKLLDELASCPIC